MKLDDNSAAQYGALAALRAHHGVHFAEALRLLGVSVREFAPYEERWIARLVAAAVADDRNTLHAFGDRYASERERLAKAAPALPPENPNTALDPDATQAPFMRSQPVLPFRYDLPSQTPSPNHPATVSLPRAAREQADDLDATMMMKSPLAQVRLPGFGAALTPTLVPEMSLDAYALLQAELRVAANAAETLRRAGVGSELALDALRQHFFGMFQRDSNAQSEFQTRFRVHLARLTGDVR